MVVQARIPALQKVGGGTYARDTTWLTLTCVYLIALETETVTHKMKKIFWQNARKRASECTPGTQHLGGRSWRLRQSMPG